MFRKHSLFVFSLLGLFLGTNLGAAGTLDQELQEHTPQIFAYLKKENASCVGVLKFLVRVGDGKLSDNIGPINNDLANRLEVALVLGLSPKKDSLRLITRASDSVVASGNRRATYRTAQGRREFFPPRINARLYQPAWGMEPVNPDGFLTGEAYLEANLKTLHVTIQYFGRDDLEKLATVCTFTAQVDQSVLGASGVSYVKTRGVRELEDDGRFNGPAVAVPPPEARLTGKAEQQKAYRTGVDKVPVHLEVLYDGKPAKLTGDQLPEPTDSTRIVFQLTNEDRKNTYGVVLKVNGENTIYKEKEDPRFCHKWILEPGKTIHITGFQLREEPGLIDKDERFKVLPPELSEGYAMSYGQDAGKILLVVFRQKRPEDDRVVQEREKEFEEVKPISRGTLALETLRPTDLTSLQGRLRATANNPNATSRGLVVGGKIGSSKVEQVLFTPYPDPILSRTIRYYEPRP
jgi:hypothetical protein